MARPTERELGHREAFVTFTGGVEAGDVAVGLTLDLERHGITVRTDRSQRVAYGAFRIARSPGRRVRVVVASEADTIRELSARSGFRLVARSSRGWLTPALDARRRQIETALDAAGHDHASAARIASLFAALRKITPSVSPIAVFFDESSPTAG